MLTNVPESIKYGIHKRDVALDIKAVQLPHHHQQRVQKAKWELHQTVIPNQHHIHIQDQDRVIHTIQDHNHSTQAIQDQDHITRVIQYVDPDGSVVDGGYSVMADGIRTDRDHVMAVADTLAAITAAAADVAAVKSLISFIFY